MAPLNTRVSMFFPPFRLDLAGEQLWAGERQIPLRPKTFAVLRYLVERAGQLVSSAQLLRAVWPEVTVSEAMPRLCIRELRTALGDDVGRPRYIETRPGRGYRFLRPTSSETGVRPLLERDADLERLHAALERVHGAERQTVFVTGERGIGKTSLVERFLTGCQAESDVWVAKGECFEPYGAGEPYLPMLTALERLGRARGGDAFLERLRRIGPTWLAQMPSLTEPAEQEALARRLSGATMQRMLRELASLLEALGAERTVVIWLEDLQWADESTLQALAFLARRTDPARVLLLGTYRPMELLAPGHPLARVKHELEIHRRCAEIALRPLTSTAVSDYLAIRFPGAPVAGPLVTHVSRWSGGNPLFMLTLVDDFAGRELIVRRDGRWDLNDNSAERPPDVPDTLRELIEQQARRLDPEDQQLLEVAAVAGSEFSIATLSAVLGAELSTVEGRAARLARNGQFLKRRGEVEWPDGTTAPRYGFVHALHQEVLYDAVSQARCRKLHARIARRLERAFGRRAPEIAAELAVHCERARDARRALRYRRLAGENALGRAAHAEAIAHLSRALEALTRLPARRERTRLEVGLYLSLGPAWIVDKGYAAPEVEHAYTRALALCRRLGPGPQAGRALMGLWNVRLVRAELHAARALATEVLARARAAGERRLLMSAHAEVGETLFHLGQLRAGRRHLDQALRYQPRASVPSRQAPRVVSYASWALWMAGFPDQARALSRQAVTQARALGYPHSRAFALGFAGLLHAFYAELQEVAELAEEAFSVCCEHEIPYWLSWAGLLRGWVLARRGRAGEGVATVREALDAHRKAGAIVGLPHFLTVLAGLQADAGEVEDGLRVIDEALDLTHRTDNRYFEPELWRQRGDLLLRLEAGPPAAFGRPQRNAPDSPEGCFRMALDTARRQGAKAFELRAATRLSRLWCECGDIGPARRLLAPLCAWFTEGADTGDLAMARQTLATLAARPGADESRRRKRDSGGVRRRPSPGPRSRAGSTRRWGSPGTSYPSARAR